MPKNPSRATRMDTALQAIRDSLEEIDCLKTELEEWRDNMPENLQGGEKYEQLEEAIGLLEEVHGEIENAVSNGESVEFPGMF